ncbi:MAG: restriction endonuclease subunit S [Verrucomicrobiae bacterium]|nr:restriction endonuclease subunit S [Verrucomicrobiae bacterium]
MTKDAKSRRTPKLRFPEFREGTGWGESELRTLADPVSDRAENEDENNILTLSGEQGLVLQSDYFGKKIAGTNAERYLRIQQDDFVYNDRVTKASAYGTIKRLKNHPHGIVSPIYKCFRFKHGELPVFWEWYFESGAHEAQLRSLANEGARAGRFNVSIDRFLSTSVWAPDSTSQEQQRIADCLSSLDELIGAERRKLDALKAHKNGLMQQLFPREGETLPRLRFHEFRNELEWKQNKLKNVSSILKGKGISKADINPDGSQPCIRYGELYTTYSEVIKVVISKTTIPATELFLSIANDVIIPSSGETKIDIAKASCVLQDDIALGADLNIIRSRLNGSFLSYCLNGPKRFEIARVAQGDAIVHLYPYQLEEIEVAFPSPDEQQRIASCLSSLDDLIAAHSDKVEALTTHKKGLMQQLFPSAAEVGS